MAFEHVSGNRSRMIDHQDAARFWGNDPIGFAAERILLETFVFTTFSNTFSETVARIGSPLIPSLAAYGGILEFAKGTLVFLCFPNGFRHAPLQRTGICVVPSGPRLGPLDLLRSGFSQKPLFFTTFLNDFWETVA